MSIVPTTVNQVMDNFKPPEQRTGGSGFWSSFLPMIAQIVGLLVGNLVQNIGTAGSVGDAGTQAVTEAPGQSFARGGVMSTTGRGLPGAPFTAANLGLDLRGGMSHSGGLGWSVFAPANRGLSTLGEVITPFGTALPDGTNPFTTVGSSYTPHSGTYSGDSEIRPGFMNALQFFGPQNMVLKSGGEFESPGLSLKQVLAATLNASPFGYLFQTQAWGTPLEGLANGGVMTPKGLLPAKRYDAGGITTTPQLALFGEGDTAEAFVPLPDGRSIPVSMQGQRTGATNQNVMVNVHGVKDVDSFNKSKGQVIAEMRDVFARAQRRV